MHWSQSGPYWGCLASGTFFARLGSWRRLGAGGDPLRVREEGYESWEFCRNCLTYWQNFVENQKALSIPECSSYDNTEISCAILRTIKEFSAVRSWILMQSEPNITSLNIPRAPHYDDICYKVFRFLIEAILFLYQQFFSCEPTPHPRWEFWGTLLLRCASMDLCPNFYLPAHEAWDLLAFSINHTSVKFQSGLTTSCGYLLLLTYKIKIGLNW